MHKAKAAADLFHHAAVVLAAMTGDEGQIVAQAMPSRAHQGPFIVEQGQALWRREIRLHARRHRLQHVGRIRGAVVPARARVGEHPWRAGAGDVHRLRLLRHHLAGWGRLSGDLEADRDLPAAGRGVRRIDGEPLLFQRDRRPPVHARDRHVEQWDAGLIDERRENAFNRFARRGGDRLREVFRPRVAVGVSLQIRVDPLLERIGADVALDHAQHGRALLVRDAVKGFVDLRRRGDLRVNRAGGLQRVEPERRLILLRFVDVDVPLRVRGGERLVGHPGGEPFVQPDVVPPLHGDEVAEPLMRHLVREDGCDRLPRVH